MCHEIGKFNIVTSGDSFTPRKISKNKRKKWHKNNTLITEFIDFTDCIIKEGF
jgi:hypothetical protein